MRTYDEISADAKLEGALEAARLRPAVRTTLAFQEAGLL